jgi:hypothetical protein
MADLPISSLPAAGALTGAEVVPVVQSGVTAQTTVTLIKDHIIGLANTWAGAQTVPDINISDTAGVARDLRWQTAGVDRWIMRVDATAESTGNAGSDFQFLARSDLGAAIGMVFSVVRSTQVVTLNQSPIIPTATAGDTSTKGASTAFVRTPAVQTVASASTVTPTFSNDAVKVTALAAACQLLNPTGTAIPFHGWVIRIKDNGTPRALTYDTQYRAVGVTLPATTVLSKTLYLGCIWNSDDSKVDVVAVAQEA